MIQRAQNTGTSNTVSGTNADVQSGETGWSIADIRRERSGGTWSDDTHALQIRIRGSVYTNAAPIFTNGASTSRDFNETIGDVAVTTASNIGAVVGATDTDTGDTLVYSLEGTDAAKFGIVTTNGQIQTKVGEKVQLRSDDELCGDGHGRGRQRWFRHDRRDTERHGPGRGAVAPGGTYGKRTVKQQHDLPQGDNDGTGQSRPTANHAVQSASPSGRFWLEHPSLQLKLGSDHRQHHKRQRYHVQFRVKNDEGEGPWSPTTFGYTKAHASGMPDISGTARVSQTLTAGTSGISDGNGKSKAENGDVGFAYTYQWVRSVSGTDTDISGETASTYTLTAADVGNTVKVKASFTDNAGYAEGPLTSNAYPTSGSVLAAFTDATLSALALVNNNGTTIALTPGFLTGTKSYTAMAGHSVSSITLTPTVNEVNATVAYLNASDAAITDTDLNTPALDAPLVVGDNTFKVKVTAEDTTTTDTYTVVVMRAATNAAATGTPSIVGTPQVGMMLTAAKGTIADFDGTTKADNGDTGYAYSYQWVRVDGSTETPITSATASTYTLTATDLGKTIKVQTSFTDDGDTAEGPLTSAATVAVLAAAGACPTDNDWCTTLTVEFQQQSPSVHYYGYADSISLGALGDRTISYGGRNWRLDALYIEDDAGTRTINIDDFFTNGFLPRGSVFTLGGQDFTATAAAEISATTSYIWPAPAGMAWIDGQKVTVSVTLANFAATGTPAISGTAQVGETLTAAIGNIADTDGLPTTFPDDYAFQWLRVDADGMSNETDIGADAVTYTPVAADVGKKVKVKVDFTDAESNPETLTSNAYPSSGTIVSETLPALSISGITVDEDAGSATLTVELDPASTGTVTVVFATRDQVGGAKAGEDYTATSGTLTFAAGQTSKTFTVPITDDDIYENYEAFFVDLSNPTGATLPVYPTAAVGIDSEDAVPTASMADVTVDEGAGTMTLILRLSHPSQEDIAYLTSAGNVTGTATEGEDYDDFLPGPGRTAIFTVPAFNLSQTFDITIVDDSVDEPDETIVIGWHKHISDDATPGAFNFIGTITDNDTAGNTAPVFTDGASTSRDFNETLGDAAVITASNIGTAVGATDSNNDTLAYSLEGADAARLGIIPTTGQLRTMAGEKYDFEAQPSYAVTVRVVDGNGGSDTIDVTVNVNNKSGETPLAPAPPTVTTTPGSMTGLGVNWVAPDNSGRPAISSYDTRYRAGAGGGWTDGPQGVTGTSASITGLAQDTSYQVQVRALNEDGDGDWSSSGSARTGAPPTPTVRFGATSYTAIEGVGGATVTVALSVAASRSVTVRLTKTHLGGATAADYTGVPSSVTFAAGETAQTFIVTAVDDTADDDGESVQLGFDTLPAGATATVRVRLSAAPGRTVTIDLTTENRGATSEDYSGLPGSVTFGASETEKSFTVTATDDSQDDDRESVAIGFGSLPSKVSAGSPSEAVVQLTDNDSVVSRLVVRFDASAEAVRDGVEEGGSYRAGRQPERDAGPDIDDSVDVYVSGGRDGGRFHRPAGKRDLRDKRAVGGRDHPPRGRLRGGSRGGDPSVLRDVARRRVGELVERRLDDHPGH